jgi:membrane-bound inhibitor of C-type lysozyme
MIRRYREEGMRLIGIALVATLLAAQIAIGSAAAQNSTIAIPLPGGQKVERMKVAYSCNGGLKVQAEYFNAQPIALATIAFKKDFVVLANVMAGSGARYAGGQYIWWTKGDNADLYDVTKGENAPPIASCKSTP